MLCALFCALAEGRAPRCARSDACWPDADAWSALNASVNGSLLVPASPVAACYVDASSSDCAAALSNGDPFFLETLPGGTEITGELNGWNATLSAYAVAARSAADVSAAVRFAARYDLELVVKGTGHDYLGRSSGSESSLLVWTHLLQALEFHDAWAADESACAAAPPPTSAVTVGAGLRWGCVYEASHERGVFTQGGGCTSVGVVGWTTGGGFGPSSKWYGTGAANLLAATVVSASGAVVRASACENSDLYYALRGGGGGWGVVLDLTVRTHALPVGDRANSSYHYNQIASTSDDAQLALLTFFLASWNSTFAGPHWGLGATVGARSLTITGPSINLTRAEVDAAWAPLTAFLARNESAYSVTNVAQQMFGIEYFWVPFSDMVPFDSSDPTLWQLAVPTPYAEPDYADACERSSLFSPRCAWRAPGDDGEQSVS